MIESLFQSFKDALFWIFNLIIDFFVYMIDIFLDGITTLFPTFEAPLDAILTIMAQVNFLIPLTYGLVLFFTYYSIKSTLILTRWVLKFIPTIG